MVFNSNSRSVNFSSHQYDSEVTSSLMARSKESTSRRSHRNSRDTQKDHSTKKFHGTGREFPVAFFSRTMNLAEKNYATSQKELLAIVKAVEHFRQFLCRKEFIIKTNHLPLTSFQTNAKPSARIGRWLGELADYKFKIANEKGTDNVLADALSRLNLPESFHPEETSTDKIINLLEIANIEEVEVIEFYNLTIEEEEEQEIPYLSDNGDSDPIELSSLDFFISALSFFEGEAKGKLSPIEQSPASPVRSKNSIINTEIRNAIIQSEEECGSSQFPAKLTKTCSCLVMMEDPLADDSTILTINALDVIVGTKSRVSSDYQMTDHNLQWLKNLINERDQINHR